MTLAYKRDPAFIPTRLLFEEIRYVPNYKASRYRLVFIFLFFSTAGRSIHHSGGCDGERVKAAA